MPGKKLSLASSAHPPFTHYGHNNLVKKFHNKIYARNWAQ